MNKTEKIAEQLFDEALTQSIIESGLHDTFPLIAKLLLKCCQAAHMTCGEFQCNLGRVEFIQYQKHLNYILENQQNLH